MFVARFALIFVAASAAIFTAGGQETVSVSSSISRVIVYLDRALVTRAANASLPAGSSIIEFAGLPATLDEGSVAVSGKSDGTLTIEGIDIRQQFLAESANPKAQELKRQIHGLQDQKKSLAGQKNVLEEKREFFKNLSSGLGKGAINLDDISKLYTFCGQELSNLAENVLSISYEVGLPVTIPSDGQPHRTNVTLLNVAGMPQYVTTPKLDPAVFLKVHLTNESEAQLLPGPLNLFRDGEFVGSVRMSLVPPSAEFDLYVGRDDSIKVERKEITSKRSETGLLNRKEVEERKYQLTLQNFRPGPIRILVYDQIPVSKNTDIVVNQGALSDNPVSVDKDTGKLSWEIELPPKRKKGD